jgi:micrococcal nuclease
MPRRLLAVLVPLLLLVAVYLVEGRGGGGSSSSPFRARVVRVVDGDTLIVQAGSGGDTRIRVIGIDTPEDVDPDKPVQCFGLRAAAFTKQLLTDRDVDLVPGRETHDRYGRTLAYVTRADGVDLEVALLRGGYARTLAIAPNVDRAAYYSTLEGAARAAGRGLWGACPDAAVWADGR